MSLHFESVSFAYPGGPPVLAEVTFALEAGEVMVLAGPSGIGKSTLARLSVGLLRPDAGRVLVAGSPPGPDRGKPAAGQLVFQDAVAAFNPRLTMRASLSETRAEKSRIREVMSVLGLDPELLRRRPARLSGGERQRFGLARALLTRPRLLVADEPAGQLDPAAALQVVNALAAVREATGCALLVISHRPDWMRRLGGRCYRLEKHRLTAAD